MDELDSVQKPQEDEYLFPYHYVSKLSKFGFRQHFTDAWGINYISTIEFILNNIDTLAPKLVVDIGCGDGRLTREISDHFPETRTVGLDYSDRAITLAKAMNQDVNGLSYEQIDITQHSFSETFDVAILMEVYEHIPLEITSSFLRGVHRSLKKGGVLLLTVPHSNKPIEYKHYQHFTIDKIIHDLSNDFDTVEVVPFEKKSFLRKILNVVLCNRVFILNNSFMLGLVYSLYRKFLFDCKNESECQRIFVKAIAK